MAGGPVVVVSEETSISGDGDSVRDVSEDTVLSVDSEVINGAAGCGVVEGGRDMEPSCESNGAAGVSLGVPEGTAESSVALVEPEPSAAGGSGRQSRFDRLHRGQTQSRDLASYDGG